MLIEYVKSQFLKDMAAASYCAFFRISGKPGTGKTLLMYDLAKADKKQIAKVESMAANYIISSPDDFVEPIYEDYFDFSQDSLLAESPDSFMDEVSDEVVAPLPNFYILTGSGTDEIINFSLEYPTLSDCICTCDPVTLKTIVRANPGVIVLQNGIVMDKYNLKNRY